MISLSDSVVLDADVGLLIYDTYDTIYCDFEAKQSVGVRVQMTLSHIGNT